jgi:hypothetical protein
VRGQVVLQTLDGRTAAVPFSLIGITAGLKALDAARASPSGIIKEGAAGKDPS